MAIEAALDANRGYVDELSRIVVQIETREEEILKRMKEIKEIMRMTHRKSVQAQLASIGISNSHELNRSNLNSKKRGRCYFSEEQESKTKKASFLSWNNAESKISSAIGQCYHDFMYPPPQKWTPSEIVKLEKAMENFDLRESIPWYKVPSMVKLRGRSGHGCFIRWNLNLVEEFEIKHPWTPAEESHLQELRLKHSWSDLANIMGNTFIQRPDLAYYLHFQRFMNPQRMKKWTPEDDDALRAAVEMHGGESNVWRLAAESLDGFSPDHCGARWRNFLCPQVKVGRFTIEEDRLIVLAYMTEVKNGDPVDWTRIKEFVPNRTSTQIRERFGDGLNPSISSEPFTATEDAILAKCVAHDKPIQWTLVAEKLPGRSNDQCRRRWIMLQRGGTRGERREREMKAALVYD